MRITHRHPSALQSTHTGTKGERERLKRVQRQVRAWAEHYPWFREALAKAFDDMRVLRRRYLDEERALTERRHALAMRVLKRGHLVDPDRRPGDELLDLDIHGLCPKGLATSLQRYGWFDAMPSDLREKSASAALSAIQRMLALQNGTAKAKKHGSHVEFWWRVWIKKPKDWVEPADPTVLHASELARFSEAEYRTIALYWLGGLADTGSLRPIVPQPRSVEDPVERFTDYCLWKDRLAARDAGDDTLEGLSPSRMPATLIEQLWRHAREWAKKERAERGEPSSSTGSEDSKQPGVVLRTAREIADKTGLTPNRLRMGAERGQWAKYKKGRFLCYNILELVERLPDEGPALRELLDPQT